MIPVRVAAGRNIRSVADSEKTEGSRNKMFFARHLE